MGSESNGLFRRLEQDLEQLGASNLRRAPAVCDVAPRANFCSNDYLGFGGEALVVRARGSASASPIVSGNQGVHDRATRALAAWLRAETATLFPSTYAANVGLLQAVGGPKALILSDALNHASIIDGCRLSRADVRVVPHLDLDAFGAVLEREAGRYERVWIITEAYFSMDADSPDLKGLRELCDQHGAGLIVDEAHSLGVFGHEGRGLSEQAGSRPDIIVGALGKAVGLHGGFVAGPRVVQDLLWNRARSLIFSTGISPLVAEAIPARVEAVRAADDRRARLGERTAELRALLGVRAPGHGPIVPLIVGDPAAAVELASSVGSRGLLARAIRPPTVPAGTARLRLTVSAVHEAGDITHLATALER